MDKSIVKEIVDILNEKNPTLADILQSYFEDVNDEDYVPSPTKKQEPREEYFEGNSPEETYKVGKTAEGHFFLKAE
jgi:hypothetical protein